MVKKRLEDRSKPVVDDFDNDDFTFDFDQEDDSGGRKPTSPLASGALKGVKDHFSDPKNIRAYVGKTLPREYGDIFDDYTQASDTIRDTIESIRKTGEQPVNQLAKLLRDKVKKGSKAHSVLSRVADATERQKDHRFDVQNNREQFAAAEMAQIFQGMEEGQAAERDQDRATEDDRFARSFAKMQSQEGLLGLIAKGSEYQRNFTQNIDIPWKKKTLELQYRMAHTLTDMFALQKAWTEQQRVQLNKIATNAALPEIAKQNLQEHFKQDVRNRFVGSTIGALTGKGGGNSNNPLVGFIERLSGNISKNVNMMLSGVGQVADGFSMMSDKDDFSFDEEDRQYQLRNKIAGRVNMGLSQVGPWAAGKLAAKGKKLDPRIEKYIGKGAANIGYGRNNVMSELQAFITRSDGGTGINLLRDLLSMGMATGDNDKSLGMISGKNLNEATNFDGHTRRSIVEVIPGLLSRILQEQQIQRTGDPKTARLVFNNRTGTFESAKTTAATIEKVAAIGSLSKDEIDELVAPLTNSGVQLNDKEKQDLAKTILASRKSGRTMTSKSLAKASFYKGTAGEANAEKFAQAFSTTFSGEAGDDKRNKFFQGVASLDSRSEQVRAYLQELANSGNLDVAEAGGWVKNGEIDINRVYDAMAGGTNSSGLADDPLVPSGGRRRRSNRLGMGEPRVARTNSYTTSNELDEKRFKLSEEIRDLVKSFYESTVADSKTARAQTDAVIQELIKLNSITAYSSEFAASSGFTFRFGGSGSSKMKDPTEDPSKSYDQQRAENQRFWAKERPILFRLGLLGDATKNMVKNAASTAMGLAVGGVQKAKELATSGVDKLRNTTLLGARRFSKFKDGIPDFGDIYIEGVDTPSIMGWQISGGFIKDSTGKIITSLKDLAESTGSIFDLEGNAILTAEQLRKTFVKADGRVFSQVWTDRIKRAGDKAGAAGRFAALKAKAGFLVGKNLTGKAVKTISSIALELIDPVMDVYVVGEDTPRLLAIQMRAGKYFNTDESVVSRANDIKGPVYDTDGNALLTLEDLKRGLVDFKGRPFKSVVQRFASFVKGNVRQLARGIKAVGNAAVGFLKKVGSGARNLAMYGLAGKGPAVATAQGMSAEDQEADVPSLLIQIRDILDARLGGGGNGQFEDILEKKFNRNAQGRNAPGKAPEASSTASSHDTIGKLAGLVGKGVSAAASVVGGLFAGRRGKAGAVADAVSGIAGGSEVDTDEITDKVGASVKDLEKKQDKSNKDIDKKLDAMMDKINSSSQDTSGVRSGSSEERRANWRNINEPTKTLADVKMPEQVQRKNTIDMAISLVKGIMGSVGGLLGSAASLLGGSLFGKGLTGILSKAGGLVKSGAGAVGGLLKGGASILGRGVAAGAGAIAKPGLLARGAKAISGIGSRIGGLAKLGGAAARFIGRGAIGKAVGSVLGGAASILGSPVVATALTIAGVAWTAYEIYNYFKDKNAERSKHLFLIRMAEYGAAMTDTSAQTRLTNLEKFTAKYVRYDGKNTSLDSDNIKLHELFEAAGMPTNNQDDNDKFLTWFNGRFSPTLLKWLTPANALTGKSLEKLDELDNEGKLKVLAATSKPTGWDLDVNPFGSRRLQVGPKEIEMARKGAEEVFKSDAKGKAAKGEKDASVKTKAEAVDKLNESLSTGLSASERARKQKEAFGDLKAIETNKNVASFASDTASLITNETIGPLMGIRMRCYGWNTISISSANSITALEKEVRKYLLVDNKGKASFNYDTSLLYKVCAPFFGLSPDNVEAEITWTTWFLQRFLPVYATYIGNVQFHAGTDNEKLAEESADPVRLYAIARAIAALGGIWKVNSVPYADFVANHDPKTIEDILTYLRTKAEEQQAKEATTGKPAARGDGTKAADNKKLEHGKDQIPNQPAKVSLREGLANDPNQIAQRQKNNKFAIPTTEGETEPKAGGGSNLSSIVRDRSSQAASNGASASGLTVAPGELLGGEDGYNFIKAKSRAEIDNLHPEMRRMFLGMAQEYGETTGKSIQVNRGYASREQQQKLWDADLASNGGRPTGGVARPGGSMHEYGLAIDIQSTDAAELERLGLMKKYGFTRPVGGETWHVEPAGIQTDPIKLRTDTARLASAIASGEGRGGGGIGRAVGIASKGSRDRNQAMAFLNAKSVFLSPVEKAATGTVPLTPAPSTNAAPTAAAAQAPKGESDPSKGSTVASGGLTTVAEKTYTKSSPSVYEVPASGGYMQSTGGASILRDATGDGSGLYASLPTDMSGRAQMMDVVSKAANGVGLDPQAAQIKVAMESGFKSGAAASTSSAKGLYQFTSGTWADMMKKYGEKFGIPAGTSPTDPRANAILGAQYTKDNMAIAGKKGLSQDITTAYLMHFLGPSGGPKLLGMADNAIPAQEMTAAASSNKAVFYNADGSPRTKAQIMEYIRGRIQTAARDFGISSDILNDGPVLARAAQVREQRALAPATSSAPSGLRAPTVSSQFTTPSGNEFTAAPNMQAPARVAPPRQTQSDETMARLLSESGKVQVEQLRIQTEIRDQLVTMNKSLEEGFAKALTEGGAKSGMPNPGQGLQPPTSRAARAMKQVSKPSYRIA